MVFEVDYILKHTVRVRRLRLPGDKDVTRRSVDIKGKHKLFY